jgi:hypothetical protein
MTDLINDVASSAMDKGGVYAPVALIGLAGCWYLFKQLVTSNDLHNNQLKQQSEQLLKQSDDHAERIQEIHLKNDEFIERLTTQFTARIDDAMKQAANERDRSIAAYHDLSNAIKDLSNKIK